MSIKHWLIAVSVLFTACGNGAAPENASVDRNVNSEVRSGSKLPVNESIAKMAERDEVALEPDITNGFPDGWESPESSDRQLVSSKDGSLVIEIRAESSPGRFPKLLKRISGDFAIEAHVKFNPKENYQGSGLIIWQDTKNFVKLERSFGARYSDENGVSFLKFVEGKPPPVEMIDFSASENVELELKISRKGNELTAFLRESIDGEWKEMGFSEMSLSKEVSVGIFGSASSGNTKAQFKSVRILLSSY